MSMGGHSGLSGSKYQLATYSGAGGPCLLIRSGPTATWGYFNPPMTANVEYLTTERINGKAVYKKNVDGVIHYRLDGETEWKPYALAVGASAKPVYTTTTMTASGWSNGTYSFESTYPKASYDISVEVAPTATVEQFEAFGEAMICGSADSNVATALGDVPVIDIPVIIKAVVK
jgi:hypothetical protein